MYTITKNPEFESLEIMFDGKPSEAVRNALKGLRFRWNSVKKLWYGYADEDAARAAIESAESGEAAEKVPEKEQAANEYGVKVGDMFVCSWGWEQTNVDFFQVVALVGRSSVRVREVRPPLVGESATGPMAADRTYKVTGELLPPAPDSIFIKDQERGDLKRINPGYYSDPAEARKNCCIRFGGHYYAYKCNGKTSKQYESWYA